MKNFVIEFDPSRYERFFSKEEANATLPLVSAIAQDIVKLSNELIDRRHRIDALNSVEADRSSLYKDELVESEKSIGDDTSRLQELVEELVELGVQPQSLVYGQVAFPTLVEGEPGFFSWQLGESEVSAWHQMEEDLLKNQPFDSLLDQSDN